MSRLLNHRARPGAWATVLLTTVLVATVGAVQAMAVGGPDGTAAQGRRSVVAAPAPGVNAPAVELQRAVIDAVDLAQQRVVLHGRAVALDPSLRVLVGSPGSGRASAGSAALLRAGQVIRFAQQPAAPGADAAAVRPIVLIYLES